MLSQMAVAKEMRSSTLIRSMPRACRVGAIVKPSSRDDLTTASYHKRARQEQARRASRQPGIVEAATEGVEPQ
jgi:hypothetical protein